MQKKYDFKYACPDKVYRILEANGIRTWQDLIFMKKKDILKIKGIGPKYGEMLWTMARKEESMCPEKYFKGGIA